MVDPYAIVKRLTGCDLITPKEGAQLIEAVDGLIDEIKGKDAELDRLTEANKALEAEIAMLYEVKHSSHWKARATDAEAKLAKVEAERDAYAAHSVEDSMRAFNWMAAHDALKAGVPYNCPTPADVPSSIDRINRLAKQLKELEIRHESVLAQVKGAKEALVECKKMNGMDRPVSCREVVDEALASLDTVNEPVAETARKCAEIAEDAAIECDGAEGWLIGKSIASAIRTAFNLTDEASHGR